MEDRATGGPGGDYSPLRSRSGTVRVQPAMTNPSRPPDAGPPGGQGTGQDRNAPRQPQPGWGTSVIVVGARGITPRAAPKVRRAGPPPKIIVGIGSGRCGTLSLARLLSRQPDTVVRHECRPVLPWDQARAPHSIRDRFLKLMSLFPDARRVGDIASYYLPYVHDILDAFPDCGVACLKRPQDETIESFVKWVERVHGPGVNHWSRDRSGLQSNFWDGCFPKYDTRDIREGIRRYWHDYYCRAEDLAARFPDNVRIFEMEGTLNEADGVRKLLEWVGIPTGEQMLLRIRAHETAGP
jgi:hypothetical protein